MAVIGAPPAGMWESIAWASYSGAVQGWRGREIAARPVFCSLESLYEGHCGVRLGRRALPGSMSDSHIRSAHRMKREVSADGGALMRTLVRLWPYIWPSDRSDLKLRVVYATLLLFGAKFATVAVPFTFK